LCSLNLKSILKLLNKRNPSLFHTIYKEIINLLLIKETQNLCVEMHKLYIQSCTIWLDMHSVNVEEIYNHCTYMYVHYYLKLSILLWYYFHLFAIDGKYRRGKQPTYRRNRGSTKAVEKVMHFYMYVLCKVIHPCNNTVYT